MTGLRDWLGVDGFAWPWALLALLLPLLVRWLVPAPTSREPALRVPWGERLRRIAGGGQVGAVARGFPWLAYVAWCLLCVAAARPQDAGLIPLSLRFADARYARPDSQTDGALLRDLRRYRPRSFRSPP